jgi:hypothetical protein
LIFDLPCECLVPITERRERGGPGGGGGVGLLLYGAWCVCFLCGKPQSPPWFLVHFPTSPMVGHPSTLHSSYASFEGKKIKNIIPWICPNQTKGGFILNRLTEKRWKITCISSYQSSRFLRMHFKYAEPWPLVKAF